MKVFCKQCVKFSRWRYLRNFRDCKRYEYSISAYAEIDKKIYYENCEKKNANNDCPDFIEKIPFWKFWKKPKTNNLENAMKVAIGMKVGK